VLNRKFNASKSPTFHILTVGNNINLEPANENTDIRSNWKNWKINSGRNLKSWFIKNSNIRVAYKDHQRQENELKKSKLNWTIVRPTGLINFKNQKKIIESYNNDPKPELTISRKNVAKFMVNALKRNELIGQAPVISE